MADTSRIMSTHWTANALGDVDAWFENLSAHTPQEDHQRLALHLLIAAARIGFRTHETCVALFKAAQVAGIHISPVHFYNPTPNTASIPEATWSRRFDDIPGLELDVKKTIRILKELSPFGAELSDVPSDGPGYHWNSVSFGGGDACLLYSLIRKHKPKRIIEIGSGHSTLIGLRALKANGLGRYQCIEPYPNDIIRTLASAGEIDLTADIVQNVSLAEFEKLGSGDILFIDSSHIAQIGSDVHYEILSILPRLKSGVLIHFHDIFLPFEVNQGWVEDHLLFWNEQHMLAAFLAFNPAFEGLIANNFVGSDPLLKELAAATFPHSPMIGGGSYWVRRV